VARRQGRKPLQRRGSEQAEDFKVGGNRPWVFFAFEKNIFGGRLIFRNWYYKVPRKSMQEKSLFHAGFMACAFPGFFMCNVFQSGD
jgi:hypothetical protein